MNRYQLGECVGQGCYGDVYRAVFKKSAKVVAIKVIQNSKQLPSYKGLPCAAYRETKALQRLQSHDNVVRLYEVFPHGGNVCIVTDMLMTDLGAIIKNLPGRYPLVPASIKTLLLMLVRGVAHIHTSGLIHRDIKPSNLLMSQTGILKIGDFGLARSYKNGADISRDMTHEVGTKWYRAPELLMGCRSYGPSIDIWSCGCVLAEMISSTPLFPGTTEIDQIITIIKHLGTPTDSNWPDRTLLPDWSKVQLPTSEGIPLTKSLPNASEGATEVLQGMLLYYGVSRLSALDILKNNYFYMEPEPVHPSQIWIPCKTTKTLGNSELVWKDRVPIMELTEIPNSSTIRSSSSRLSKEAIPPQAGDESNSSSSGSSRTTTTLSSDPNSDNTTTRTPSPSIVVPRPPLEGRISHTCSTVMAAMESQLAALFEALRGVNTTDSLKREDVDEIAMITGMSVKASRKLLRKYRGNKDDALMAWFDKDVDSSALEAASDSENEDDSEVTENINITSDWPLFPDVVDWVSSSCGCSIDLENISKKEDKELIPLESRSGDIIPADVTQLRASGRRVGAGEEDEKEIFAGLSIGQPVRIRRYDKEMRQSRAGWKDDSEFDQKRLCGKIGTVRAVTRRDLTARVEFTGFGSGWWDIRWVEILPPPLVIESNVACSGAAVVKGDRKQIKLAQRCISLITTCIRISGLGVFLDPVKKALDQVVPSSKGEVHWRALMDEDEVLGYQLCVCDPRAVGQVARCLEGELTLNIDKCAAVSEDVVTRVAKLARSKTGCVVVSAPKGEAKMDAGALVIRNPRCWVGGNADGLEGKRVAPGIVLGCDGGRAQVFWMNSNAVATHRWGFDDTFDLVLMPCFAPIGRLLVVCVGIERIPGLTWDMLLRVVKEALTMEGAEMIREVLTDPQYMWNGKTFEEKIDTEKFARDIVSVVVGGWATDGVLPRPLISEELSALLNAIQENDGSHLGIWREAKVTVHQFYCSTPSRREGPICQHPGGAFQAPHWGCCGQQAVNGACRQIERRTTPLHPKHILHDRTMSIMTWACDRCKCRAEPQQGQRWRCDDCDYDLCDPCLHDSLREVKKNSIVLSQVADSDHVTLLTVLDQEVLCELNGDSLLVTPADCKTRHVKDVSFTVGEDGTRPIITFSDPDMEKHVTLDGVVHGFHAGQIVHAAKDIYVAVAVAVQQGGHGTVIGPSTSGDPRRVCIKFLGREAKINVMPVEVKAVLDTPRRARLQHLGKPIPVYSEVDGPINDITEVPCNSEVVVIKDGPEWANISYNGVEGFTQNTYLRELNTQSTVITLCNRGLPEAVASLRQLSKKAGIKCNIPQEFELTVGGKLPAVIVSGLTDESDAMNGVYRRSPAEEDCRVIFRKGDHTLYFRGSWWKLNNNVRHDGWLQSSRALTGKWSPANAHDARVSATYPTLRVGTPQLKTVPTPVTGTSIVHIPKSATLTKEGNIIKLGSTEISGLLYHIDTFSLVFTHSDDSTTAILEQNDILEILSKIKGLVAGTDVECQIPDEVEIVEPEPLRTLDNPLTLPDLNKLCRSTVEATGGDSVGTILSKHGWKRNGGFEEIPAEDGLLQIGKQLHELVGEKMTADISMEVVAPKSTTVAVVGPMTGRQKAKGFLSRLHDLQEVAIRVPSENHAVVERHRADIQKHAHTHMNVGFGGAIVRLTGTASAIRQTRRAIATLLMKHWREQQRQRREVVLEQVVANAMEVRIKVPLTPAMKELLDRKEIAPIQETQRRHDEAEAERRQDEQRVVSMTQELSREYERLSNSLRNQLAACGIVSAALCTDDFTRSDRVIRGPTWQWGEQDGGAGSSGRVLGGHDEDGWVVVEWDKSGRLARHRTGPLFQDLKLLEPVVLPKMLETHEFDPVTVLRGRTAAHASHSLDILRKCAVCKYNWAEEEHRQKGIVHEARIGVKEMEAAEKFQGWLRDLFGVKERAAAQVAEVKQLIDSDSTELTETMKLLDQWETEYNLSEKPEPHVPGQLCVCICTEDQLYGQGNTPFDVCSRRSIPRQSRIRLSHDCTINDCYRAVEKLLGVSAERQRLWYFVLRQNGTFRPAVWLKRSDTSLFSACQPPPVTVGEIQVLVELLPEDQDAPSTSETLIWKVQQVDGFPGVPFRPTKEASSTRDIPNGVEVEVLEEDGDWVRILYGSEEGFIRRQNVTREGSPQGILFLKFFKPDDVAVDRLGFQVIDFNNTCVIDMCKVVNVEREEAEETDLQVYVEESPESLRMLTDMSQTLAQCGLGSGALLVFQNQPPLGIQRALKVGDVVTYTGPSHRSSILEGSEGRVTGINHAQQQVKVMGTQGETDVFSNRSVALDPKSIGLSYAHATAPSMFFWTICRKDLPQPQCPAAHSMTRIDNPRRFVCSYCQAPGVSEMAFWGCRTCDHFLCLLCTVENRLSTKISPELSPRQQPWAGRFPAGKIRDIMTEHTERIERMNQSLRKHRRLLDDTVSEVLMHVRRLGEQRQHRRLFGWDLLLHLMDTTGCLLELQEENLVVVGRPHSVRKAVSSVETLQKNWPPSSLPTEATIEIGDVGVDKLFAGAGIIARGLQFECGLQEIEPSDSGIAILVRGKRENIQQAMDRLDLILQLNGKMTVEWVETAPATFSKKPTPLCPVCLMEIESEEDCNLTLACGHSLHIDCGVQYLQSRDFSKEPIPCMEHGCSYVLRVSEYSQLAIADGLQKPSMYYDNLLREALLRHDKVVACPLENCTGWAVSGNVVGTVENLHCFECDKLFCPICQQLGHFFSQCEEVQEAAKIRAGAEKKQKLEQEEESRKAIAELCRPCPRCGAQVSRTEGCPHMTCKVCKFEFCYDCLRAIPHFGECDKAKLADRMRRVRAEHGGVIYHKYTKCDICGKHPIPDSEEAFTCLNCLHWSICGSCESKGQSCGTEGHILSILPRSDEPPAEAVVKGEKQKWRLKLNEVPYYEIDWEIVRNRATPMTAGSAPACGGGIGFEKQVSSRYLNKSHNRIGLNLGTPINGDWGNTTKTSSLIGKDITQMSGTLSGKAETVLFEWEESEIDTGSDTSYAQRGDSDDDFHAHHVALSTENEESVSEIETQSVPSEDDF